MAALLVPMLVQVQMPVLVLLMVLMLVPILKSAQRRLRDCGHVLDCVCVHATRSRFVLPTQPHCEPTGIQHRHRYSLRQE